jgi:hypothetical protein
MRQLEIYLGIVLVSVVLYYLFKDPNGTSSIFRSLSSFNVNAINALQGRGGAVVNVG